ncbi:MAG: cell division protein FtsA [Bacteroidales bacterium]|nr:cell division protein FtsA [Bacteroidales bacterium]
MEQPNVCVVSLDIGTTKIAAIVGRRNEYGKIEVLGHGRAESGGVIRGIVCNIENTIKSIKDAVQQAKEESGVEIKYVYVGIAGQHICSRQQPGHLIRTKGGEEVITEQELQDMCDNIYNIGLKPGEEIIDIIPQEYTIDGESGITDPVGMIGNSIQASYHVIIGQTAAARNICTCVTQAGLETLDLILEPIASASAVLSADEKEMGVALVDIGGGTTDLAIFYNGIIRHTKVIPLGGDIVTNDVKEGCSILKRQAEELKIKFGSAFADENKSNEYVSIAGLQGRAPKEISVKNLAHIIQARMEEIMEYVKTEIKMSGYAHKLGGGIVLTGGGSLLKHVVQLTQYVTGMDVRIGYPNEHLSNNQNVKVISNPIFSTGIGLIVEGFAELDKEMKKNEKNPNIIDNQIDIEQSEAEEQEELKPKKKKRRSFFESIINGFFDDETK